MTGYQRPVRILAVSGSLRRRSYNGALLRAASDLAPESITVATFDRLQAVPVFNEDLESDPQDPPGVMALRADLAASDGLLIATPEYNQSVPGVVKNMIDWLSRSRPGGGLAGRPVAVAGVTTGPWGTRIAQTVLRQMLLSTQALVLPGPSLFVAHAGSLFDADGELVDPETRARLRELVVAFAEWIRLVSPDNQVAGTG